MLDTSTFKFKVILIANAVFYSKCACLIDGAAKIHNCNAVTRLFFLFAWFRAINIANIFTSFVIKSFHFRLSSLG